MYSKTFWMIVSIFRCTCVDKKRECIYLNTLSFGNWLDGVKCSLWQVVGGEGLPTSVEKEIRFRERGRSLHFDERLWSINRVNSDFISTLNADDVETTGKLGGLEETNVYFPSSFRPLETALEFKFHSVNLIVGREPAPLFPVNRLRQVCVCVLERNMKNILAYGVEMNI